MYSVSGHCRSLHCQAIAVNAKPVGILGDLGEVSWVGRNGVTNV